MALDFTKMHGAGNDFVVLDRRHDARPLDAALIARLADRRRGVGFDQLLTIEPPRSIGAMASYRVWNTDGSMAQQCGNGARCLVAWLARDRARRGAASPAASTSAARAPTADAPAGAAAALTLDGPAGPIHATVDGERIRVDMGVPRFAPAEVPFRPAGTGSADAQAHRIELRGGPIEIGVASIGNPHALIVVDGDVSRAPVETLGPALECHAAFPERVNVGFAQVRDRAHVSLRVYERGVGETLACGSGACAAAAILRRRGLVEARVEVTLPGGTLTIEWQGEGAPLWMSGPATFVFEGQWTE